MGLFSRLFRREPQSPSTPGKPEAVRQQETTGRVTSCRLWKCPNCGELLEKTGLGTLWMPSDPLSKVAGTATCGRCGSEFSQSEVYGGRFDVQPAATVGQPADQAKQVSVVVFVTRSHQPPADPESYCRKVAAKRFPGARVTSHYVVGFADDLSVAEALALYQRFVETGQLPRLDPQMDAFTGRGPDGKDIVALFFAG
ncbi:MAG: hypothetical protein ACUVX8_08940 [Candidatus Zipacnadales bacterium]